MSISAPFHKYDDVCGERAGVEGAKRRRVDAGYRRGGATKPSARPVATRRVDGGCGRSLRWLSSKMAQHRLPPPALISPHKPHLQTSSYLWNGTLRLCFRLVSFVFLGLTIVSGAPRQQIATSSDPTALDLASLLGQFGEEPSAAQLGRVRDWLGSHQPGQWEAAFDEVLKLTDSRPVHDLLIQESHRRKHHASARKRLSTLSDNNPSTPTYLVNLVQLEILAGDGKRARGHLRSAATRFPKLAQIHSDLGQWLFDHGQGDLAFAELLRAQSAGTLPPRAALVLASMEATVGAYKDGIDTASSIEKRSDLPAPVRAEAAALTGKTYALARQEKDAARYLEQAIELAPEVEDYYLSLAKVHQQSQSEGDALAVLREGHGRLPEAQGLGVALARRLMTAGDFNTAIGILSGISNRSPDQLEALSLLAQAHRASGNPKLATQTWRRLAQHQPRYPMVHVFLAQSLSEEGASNAEVLEALKTAEATSPGDSDVYYLRGRVYNEMGQHEEAVKELTRAISMQPNIPSPYYQLGLAYQQLGQEELARKQFEKKERLEGATSGR